jgi:hypothetical protein
MRMVMTCIAAMLLGGCGASSERGSTVRSQTSAATPTTARARQPPPTRLVAGPVLFRVTGAPKPTASNLTPQLLYTMIFRLDREPRAKPGRPVLALDPLGNYSIINSSLGWGQENAIFAFGERRRHCFVGFFDTETAPPQLRAVPLGARVRITLQPTKRTASGGLKLGTVYERHPRLLHADNYLKNRRAREALNRIGCPAKQLT